VGTLQDAIEEEKNDEGSRQIAGSGEGARLNVYDRFSRHVRDSKIERDDFCRSVHIYLTQEEMQQCFD